MKDKNTIGMLAAVVFAVGMVGINVTDNSFDVFMQTSDTPIESGFLMGHLEIIHTDSDGNVKAYIQTDNRIQNDGERCVAFDLFGTGASDICTTDPGTYRWIALDDTSVTTLDSNSTALVSELAVNGLSRAVADSVTVQTESKEAGASTQVVRISKTFTHTAVGPQTVLAAGLFNMTLDTTNESMFAGKDFPSVSLGLNDQLTLNWDITISGSDATS